MTTTTTTKKMTVLQGMARQEGFGASPTNRPTRNHNPGDIEYGKYAAAHGAVGNDDGYAIFPDDTTGFAAYRVLLQGPAYRGKTVQQAIYTYCPPPTPGQPLTEGNRPDIYLENICAWCDVQPEDDFQSVLG